jgi:hypothetical protein
VKNAAYYCQKGVVDSEADASSKRENSSSSSVRRGETDLARS